MRRAFNDYFLITNEAGDEFVGVSLGYDFCAEHEWGISGLRRDFGLPEPSRKNMGIKSRTITQSPSNLIFKKVGDYALLWTGSKYSDKQEDVPYGLKNYKSDLKWQMEHNSDRDEKDKKDAVLTAWSEGDFAVAVKGKKESAWLEELYNQFLKKNIVIARMNTMPWNPFSNASLALAIADKLPKEITDQMYAADKEHFDLQDYCKKIGLTKLKEKNKGKYREENYFMACSPRWIDYDNPENREKRKKELDTKYDIQIWINYSDDDDNYGWYRFEDIKKWLTTKGLKLSQIRKG